MEGVREQRAEENTWIRKEKGNSRMDKNRSFTIFTCLIILLGFLNQGLRGWNVKHA